MAKYPVSEMDAFAAYRAAQFAAADYKEVLPTEIRYQFPRAKQAREREADDRRAIAKAVADRHGMSLEHATEYVRNRRQLGLMPLDDWRRGAETGPRLPCLFLMNWTPPEVDRGGPNMSMEEPGKNDK